jgi:hypothetical protein
VANPASAARAMTQIMNKEYWELQFNVEVSALYHARRRASLRTVVRTIRAITLFGSFIVIAVSVSIKSNATALVVAGPMSALIAFLNLLDLTENFTARAEGHDQLYKRFKTLQANIDRHYGDADRLSDFQAEAESIRIDEPPTMWAIYAQCWNQAIKHYLAEPRGYYRKIPPWRRLVGRLFNFHPQDFPVAEDSST